MSLPINLSDLLNGRTIYFLKELHLTEARATGFPTIYDAMAKNGSPAPVFDTDDSTYFLVTIPVHEAFGDRAGDRAGNRALDLEFNTLNDIIAFCAQASVQASAQALEQAVSIIEQSTHDKVKEVLAFIPNWKSKELILEEIGLSSHHKNKVKYIDSLVEQGWIELKYPYIKTHPEQRYKLTDSGKRLLELINPEKTK